MSDNGGRSYMPPSSCLTCISFPTACLFLSDCQCSRCSDCPHRAQGLHTDDLPAAVVVCTAQPVVCIPVRHPCFASGERTDRLQDLLLFTPPWEVTGIGYRARGTGLTVHSIFCNTVCVRSVHGWRDCHLCGLRLHDTAPANTQATQISARQ